uniref:Uncharacterized protein n=1 Tax=Leptocylindrus danicus TaxID=163516 RepID=A0A7S2LNX7_9STRA|mmetsp:Transcript_814/g.1142  ORF Transcript_814/g.1142 Transcript_814/m.1142 type:complete len:313 (+) Transcript_814:54-992(+)
MMSQEDTPRIYCGIDAGIERSDQCVGGVVLNKSETCLAISHVDVSLSGLSRYYGDTCNETTKSTNSFSRIPGTMLITSDRIVFAADENNETFDLSIDAGLVSLHALSSEPQNCMYCQLDLRADDYAADEIQSSSDQEQQHIEKTEDEAAYTPVEVYFFPVANRDDTIDVGPGSSSVGEQLGQIFDALSTMAELNPDDIDDDHGDGNDDGDCDGFFFMGGDGNVEMTSDPTALLATTSYSVDGGNGCESGGATASSEGEATEEERASMLERLDALLLVPPELELDENGVRIREISGQGNDGQFSDAEEDDGLL